MLRLKERGHDVRTRARHRGHRAGRPAHGARPAAKPGLRDRRGAHAGARHRRQHRDLLGRRSAPAPAASVPDGEQLRDGLRSPFDGRGSTGADRNVVSPANWLDWQRESRTLQALAAWRTAPTTLTGVGEPTRLNAQTRLLGVLPAAGRRAASGPNDVGRGRSAKRPARRRPQPSAVAAALRRRSERRSGASSS